MGLISRLLAGQSTKAERRNINAPDVVRVLTGGMDGRGVGPGNAEQISAVLACVRVLAESVAMLPLVLYQRDGRNRLPATDHPLYPLLYALPNSEMTSFDLRAAMMRQLALWGNAYAQIVRDQADRVRELWPLRADCMTPEREGDVLRYKYQSPGQRVRYFMANEILHVKGLTTDGLVGLSVIAASRRAFGTSISMEIYQESFYDNGAQPGGLLKHPGTLTEGAAQRLADTFEERHGGPGGVNKLAVLEEGLDYVPLNVPQSDQQFLEQKKYSKDEIAALFRVPAHMINSLERATFGNIEEMGQEFVDYTLTPWFVQWEQAIQRDLLQPAERGRYYAKHKAQALLRGNNTSRAQFYSNGLQWGYFTINDVRELEDLNPTKDGDTHFVPLNMVPLDKAVMGVGATQQPTAREMQPAPQQRSQEAQCTCERCRDLRELQAMPAPTLRDDDDPVEDLRVSRVEMARSMQGILEDVARRLTRREVRDVGKAVEKFLGRRSVGEFVGWLNDYYRTGDFTPAVRDGFRATMLSYARQAMMAASAELQKKSPGLVDELREFVDRYLDAMADSWAAGSRQQIEALLELPEAQADPAPVIEQRLADWEQTKPGKVGEQQSFEMLNALVTASYGYLGVKLLRWAASGASCPFCRSLDGQVAGIEKYFIESGSSIDGGLAGVMRVERNTRYGPLHRGCDCVVIAA